MASIFVVAQMSFRTTEDAGEYQSHVFDESGFEAQLRVVGNHYAVITVVEAKNKAEAEGIAAYLREFTFNERIPQVTVHTRGDTQITAASAAIEVAAPIDAISEARRRYDESPKAQEYRRMFRQSVAFKRSQQAYQQSSAGRAAQRRYTQTAQGKERRQAYQRSEKGKQARKQYQDRRRARLRELKNQGLL